jgi:GTPase SAR1 family protein
MKKVKFVICPFCCHRFHPNEADFRLPASGGTAKGKKKQKELEIDEKLYDYQIEILQASEKEATTKAMQPMAVEIENNEAVSFDEKELEKYGFVQHIYFAPPTGKKIMCEKRLCPNCHNDLPIGYGIRDTLLISILGDARVGKSVFLTVLISELENNSDFASKLTFIGDKQVRETFYENYQKPLLKDHELISSTKRRKIPPYAFNFWYRYKNEEGAQEENSIDVIFYDIAGEDLRDDLGIRQNGFNIKDSSGLIFLVDPTNFAKLSDLFRISDASLIEAIPEENSNQQIFNTLYNYFLGFEREKSPIPMALVLSKADLLSFVNFDFFNNKPENRIQHLFVDEMHQGAVNIRSIKGLNQEVRELLSYLGEESVLNNALGCFKAVNCFAVSSLGKKPTVEQISDPETNETIEKGYVDGPLVPFRVKEAFYWILMRHRLLHKYENNRYSLHVPPQPEERLSFWRRIAAFFAGR